MKHHLPFSIRLLPDGTAQAVHGWFAVSVSTVVDQRDVRREQLNPELCGRPVRRWFTLQGRDYFLSRVRLT